MPSSKLQILIFLLAAKRISWHVVHASRTIRIVSYQRAGTKYSCLINRNSHKRGYRSLLSLRIRLWSLQVARRSLFDLLVTRYLNSYRIRTYNGRGKVKLSQSYTAEKQAILSRALQLEELCRQLRHHRWGSSCIKRPTPHLQATGLDKSSRD